MGLKLVGSNLYRYRLPLTAPLRLKGRDFRHREGLLLELVGEDGSTGLGEAAPLPGFSRESLEEAAGQLGDLASSMLGHELDETWTDPDSEPARELDGMRLAPSVRFGFELAVWNLLAGCYGKILPELLASRPARPVSLNALISGPPETVLGEARRARDAGYRAVKLKVGVRDVGEAAELVRDVAGVIGEGVALRIDANRAWSFVQAEDFARATADLPYEYVEEPLAEPRELSRLVREYGVPVALDESLVSMQPDGLEEHRYARAVVLKPTLLGGLTRSLRFAAEARRRDMAPVVSAAYETGVGTLGLVALASGLSAPGGGAPAGLDTYRRLAADVLSLRPELATPVVDVSGVFSACRSLDRGRLEPVRL